MVDSIFSPLKNKRYSDQIAEQIQGKILKHQLELGSSLPSEQELAREFQVSRSVIREALRILEISGLVTLKKDLQVGSLSQMDMLSRLKNLLTIWFYQVKAHWITCLMFVF